MKTNNIVSDGRERLLDDPEIKTAISKIEKKVREEYAQLLSEAGWLGKKLLRMKMNREIRERIERIAPRDALYFASNNGDRDQV
jgi:hypothetical protein